MLRIKGNFSMTFCIRDGFRVDITYDSDTQTADAWIYHKDYGIKSLMFGSEITEDHTLNDFIEVVEGNVQEYMEDYCDEYMD